MHVDVFITATPLHGLTSLSNALHKPNAAVPKVTEQVTRPRFSKSTDTRTRMYLVMNKGKKTNGLGQEYQREIPIAAVCLPLCISIGSRHQHPHTGTARG